MAEGITASCGAARRPPRLPAALERFGGDFTLYSSAATSLGLTVRYTENRRSDHDEWSNGTNGNAIIHQGTVAAVNLYIASQAAALASPSMTSSTRFLEGGRVPSDPEIAPPPPLQLSLCCRCTRHDGGAGDLTVLVPRQGHEDVLALATLDALKSQTWMPCTLRHPTRHRPLSQRQTPRRHPKRSDISASC